jgi:hypothetical protein
MIMKAAYILNTFHVHLIKKTDKLRGKNKTISVLNYARKDLCILKEQLHAFFNSALDGVHGLGRLATAQRAQSCTVELNPIPKSKTYVSFSIPQAIGYTIRGSNPGRKNAFSLH